MHRRRRDHRRPFAGSGGGAGGRVNRGNRGYRRIVTGPAARYDEIADFYDAAKGESVADPATAALLRLAGPVSGMRLLEVACGQGRVARELARRGAQVTGLDIAAALLAKARAQEQATPLGIGYL